MIASTKKIYPHASRGLAQKEIQSNIGQTVGPENPKAEVVVLDNFATSDDFGTSHGDKVARVFTLGGIEPEQIRLVQTSVNTNATFDILKSKEGSASDRLSAFVQGTALDFLESTHSEIDAQAQGEITLINHSQTLSPAKTARYLFNQAIDYGDDGFDRTLTGMGVFLCEALGLPQSADWENECALNQRLNDLTDKIYNEDPTVLTARDAFNSRLGELKSQGIIYVTPSGNDGKVLKSLERSGIQVAASMVYGLNSVSEAIVVGAFDDKGTSDLADDSVADFSVRHPSTDFLGPGVDIDLGLGFLEDGTSYATPHVGLRYQQLRQANPEKAADELLLALADSGQESVRGSDVAVVR